MVGVGCSVGEPGIQSHRAGLSKWARWCEDSGGVGDSARKKMRRFSNVRIFTAFASTAMASLISGACGRTDLLGRWQSPPVNAPDGFGAGGPDGGLGDRRDAALVGDVGVPMLKLLAGGLGGRGDLNGTGPAARFFRPYGVASDGVGNLFVADSANHTIRKVVATTGAVTPLAGSPQRSGSADGTGPAAQFSFPQGVASDAMGNLYVADTGNHTIRMVVIATGAVTTLAGSARESGVADGVGTTARFNTPWGVATDGVGNLFVADSKNRTVRKVVIATGVVTTLAGSPEKSGSADGVGADARFNSPSGLASDGAGSLFVADSGSDSIRTVVIATGSVTTLAGGGGWGQADGTGAAARFRSPSSLASDGAGSLLVADSVNNAIRQVVIATGVVTTLAGSRYEYGSADGTGAAARFNHPYGVASDGAGNLFVADTDNHTIRKVAIATGTVTTLAGPPDHSGSADGTGSAAQFDGPWGVVSDGNGNLFVADSVNVTVRTIAIATGAVTTLMSSRAHIGILGPYPLAGVASDGTGNLFVADPGDHEILRIRIATGDVFGSTAGLGSDVQFDLPSGVASDGGGNLFVTDSGSHTLRKVVIATGAVSTLAGSADQSGGTDGTGAAARFNSPSGLASDGVGNLFLADSGNHTIRKVVIATGAVSTLVGSPENMGSTDGTGTVARFNSPGAVASDGAGNLFIADTGNNTIRKVVVATGVVTTVVGSPGNAGVILGPLPAGLTSPRGLAFGPAGDLYITDENAVLVAQF